MFEETVLPHLNAAFNYARWLTRKDEDAANVVQDAYVRTMRFFSPIRDDDARSWLFAIVRNTSYSRVTRRRAINPLPLDMTDEPADSAPNSETRLMQQQTVARVRRALEQLRVEFRELLVLREIMGTSYKEIAAVFIWPTSSDRQNIGTGPSRIPRAPLGG